MSAVVDIAGLRQGVRALRVPNGLLFHDPVRWRLFGAPAGLEPAKLKSFLVRQGLDESSPEPPPKPRLRQLFWVARDQAPDGDLVLPPQARFSCVCCGGSCHSMGLGPILERDADRL